jgi:citrate synthase
MERLQLISHQIKGKESLTITDSRSGKTYDLPIGKNFVKSSDLQKIKFENKVMRGYDPGYMNTMTCTSTISFIDGDRGIL